MHSGLFYKCLFCGILLMFLSVLFTVGFVATRRHSGMTGLDAAQMQVVREEKKALAERSP